VFSSQTLEFLGQLRANNNRDWFEANKPRYESDVREPALAYIEAMAPHLAKISGSFLASPKKVGGSLMRVYRDVRFSKDKTPYKTNIGIQFRHVAGKDVHAPGFYLHIDPDEVFLGAGIWRPDNPTLQQMRLLIDDDQPRWRKLTKKLVTRGYNFGGESLKRPPKGYDNDHPLIEDLKRKDFIAVLNLDHAAVPKKDFLKVTAKHFAAAGELVEFICNASDLDF
jgi:uncharacterized protein (TIGR02453 family)